MLFWSLKEQGTTWPKNDTSFMVKCVMLTDVLPLLVVCSKHPQLLISQLGNEKCQHG